MPALDPWGVDPVVVASSRPVRPGVHLLVVVDELDMATAPQLAEAARAVLAAPPRVLAVDVSGVGFMASAGLAALLRIHEDATAAGCRMVLVAVPRPVRRVIELIGLGPVFDVHEDLAAVLAERDEHGAPHGG